MLKAHWKRTALPKILYPMKVSSASQDQGPFPGGGNQDNLPPVGPLGKDE
jgi:hypothetical protein